MATRIDTVNANLTKNFFITMLTRDIYSNDAILDLLDNYLNGVMRLRKPAFSFGFC